jgi:hypothetical protein
MQYDGTGKLGEAIAGLYGLSLKSQAQIAAHIKKAKAALSITNKAKVLPDDVRLAIYRWHVERLTPDTAVQATPETEADTHTADNGDYSNNEASAVIIDTGEASSGSPKSLEPLPPLEIDNAPTVAIDAQPMPTTTESQRSGNWGGVRQGSGRKATGKQTVTVRVPVELVGMIAEAKRTGLIPVTDNQDKAALLARVQELEKVLQDSTIQPRTCQRLTPSGGTCPNPASHNDTVQGHTVYVCATHHKHLTTA